MNAPTFAESLPTIKLLPGELVVVTSPREIVWSVLGSCVSVILHVPGKISAVCHAQMPSRSQFDRICSDSCPHPCFKRISDSNDFKFVTCSIEYMIDSIREAGADPRQVRVSLLGGASVLPPRASGGESIGSRNLAVARETFASLGLGIARERTGGSKVMSFRYFTGSDQLLLRIDGSKTEEELPTTGIGTKQKSEITPRDFV